MGWSCVVTFDAKDCISDHWAEPLRGWSEPAGIRAPCPVRSHRSDRGPLSIQVKGGRPVWNCHCGCTEELIGRAIADRVPCYTWSPRRPKRGLDPGLARELLLDLLRCSPNSRTKAQVALVREFGLGEQSE